MSNWRPACGPRRLLFCNLRLQPHRGDPCYRKAMAAVRGGGWRSEDNGIGSEGLEQKQGAAGPGGAGRGGPEGRVDTVAGADHANAPALPNYGSLTRRLVKLLRKGRRN
ncbi:Protein of unknown function [Gryllus bimaculatus]|nr:Protein of unknown function [Gryllus bimaculatus]